MSHTQKAIKHGRQGGTASLSMVLTVLPTKDVHISTWDCEISHYLTMGSTPTGPMKLTMVTTASGFAPVVADWTERARPEARRPRGEWKATALDEAAELICENMLPEDLEEVLNFLVPAFEET